MINKNIKIWYENLKLRKNQLWWKIYKANKNKEIKN
jgi:hypothetical protein